MEDLKHLLDNKSLADINQELSRFIHSANGHKNVLKLVFALQYIISEADKLLRTINKDDFISSINDRIGDIDKQAQKLYSEYHGHITQNDIVSQSLAESSNNKIESIQSQISALLTEYDKVIKTLVEYRERLSIEQQILAEKNNGQNNA